MRLRNLLALILLGCLISACNLPIQDATTPADKNADIHSQLTDSAEDEIGPPLATPVAHSPAAGICARFEGQIVTITIRPDIPDPRCAFIRPDQILEVVNNRGETLQVKIGHLQAELSPGQSHTFDLPFGEYLLPGVHRIEVQPCCGAELVLE